MTLGRGEIQVRAEPETEDEKAAAEALADLDRMNQELHAQVGRLTKDLAAARRKAEATAAAGARSSSREDSELAKENAVLRKQLAELEAKAPSPAAESATESDSAASKLVFKMQRENALLKKKLAGAKPEKGDAALSDQVAVLKKTVGALKKKLVSMADSEGGGEAKALATFRDFVRDDDEGTAPDPGAGVDAFLLVEGYRFLRRVERVVTRVAGSFIQLLSPTTVMPGMEGNLRHNLARILETPDDSEARAEHLEYLQQLARWLVAALGAHRQAAVTVLTELVHEFSEDGLTEKDPIPALKRIAGKREAELWRRLCAHRAELTAEILEERVEKHARKTAQEVLDGHGGAGFPA